MTQTFVTQHTTNICSITFLKPVKIKMNNMNQCDKGKLHWLQTCVIINPCNYIKIIMGFGNHGKCLAWSVKDLSFKDVKILFMKGVFSTEDNRHTSCRLDVDVSWVAKKLGIGKSESGII